MKIYKRLFSYAPEGKHNGYIAVFFISFIGFFNCVWISFSI